MTLTSTQTLIIAFMFAIGTIVTRFCLLLYLKETTQIIHILVILDKCCLMPL